MINSQAKINWLLLIIGFALPMGACVSIKIKPSQPKSASVNKPYSETFEFSGQKTPICNVLVIDGNLPPGLGISHKNLDDSIVIAGQPIEIGDYVYTLEVTTCGTNFAGKTATFRQTLKVTK